jgi:hypothetical protein
LFSEVLVISSDAVVTEEVLVTVWAARRRRRPAMRREPPPLADERLPRGSLRGATRRGATAQRGAPRDVEGMPPSRRRGAPGDYAGTLREGRPREGRRDRRGSSKARGQAGSSAVREGGLRDRT